MVETSLWNPVQTETYIQRPTTWLFGGGGLPERCCRHRLNNNVGISTRIVLLKREIADVIRRAYVYFYNYSTNRPPSVRVSVEISFLIVSFRKALQFRNIRFTHVQHTYAALLLHGVRVVVGANSRAYIFFLYTTRFRFLQRGLRSRLGIRRHAVHSARTDCRSVWCLLCYCRQSKMPSAAVL